jgi:8-oxo-dGTP pyrophosphatase MutT (NUDIX family)
MRRRAPPSPRHPARNPSTTNNGLVLGCESAVSAGLGSFQGLYCEVLSYHLRLTKPLHVDAYQAQMGNSGKTTAPRRVQYAALPYRLNGHAQPEVMLVTSRQTRRWIIPKGWPHKGKTPHLSAAREAFEEAGVVGAVSKDSIGSFSYQKRLRNGVVVDCEVRVFALEVKRQRKAWPEQREREVRWLSARAAARMVREPTLSAIIRRLARGRTT